MEENISGLIFDIQGFSVHDGPGCRTVVFFKGCSLKCSWCCNPESQSAFAEPLFHISKCIGDFNCLDACPHGAITITNDRPVLNRKICAECSTFNCTQVCYPGALKAAGYRMDVATLFERLQRDRPYWGLNGGITLSGGEPFLQPRFAAGILSRAYEAYIHTAAETCGNVPFKNIQASLPYLDWIFYDLKHMDDDLHQQHCGFGNKTILANALALSEQFQGRLVFRLPLIPGFNNSKAALEATAAFIHKTGRNQLNILPLHHLGREKYSLKNIEYKAAAFTPPAAEAINQAMQIFASFGITCWAGSDTPF